VQNDAKKAGLPWTAAKGYDTFCPVGKFLPAAALPDPHSIRLWLKVRRVPPPPASMHTHTHTHTHTRPMLM
jgi:2-keto-4-pentenoate hydratase/2-oxohepta-3-ene-1,7-dioic acid hydratase in catechol pathway